MPSLNKDSYNNAIYVVKSTAILSLHFYIIFYCLHWNLYGANFASISRALLLTIRFVFRLDFKTTFSPMHIIKLSL